MTRSASIASLTIAYNNAATLPRQLEALRQQTRSLNEIIVVDNASSDNTLNLLAEQYHDVTLLNLPENRGVGGGYSAGLSHTMQRHDWTWLLDGDSVPPPDTLENLLRGLQQLGEFAESTAIVAPLCVNSHTGAVYPGLMWRNGWEYTDETALARPVVFVDSVISSGSLLRSDAARQVGLPRSDFFIDFVDHEHCFRLRRAGYNIAMITSSRMAHTIGSPRRIHFLGLTKQWVDHPAWREYYMARNAIFTIWQYYPDWRSKLSITRDLLYHFFEIMLFGRQKATRVRMIFEGLCDASSGRLGVRYLPSAGREGMVESRFAAHCSENA
jgi:rhamnosyltransferase